MRLLFSESHQDPEDDQRQQGEINRQEGIHVPNADLRDNPWLVLALPFRRIEVCSPPYPVALVSRLHCRSASLSFCRSGLALACSVDNRFRRMVSNFTDPRFVEEIHVAVKDVAAERRIKVTEKES